MLTAMRETCIQDVVGTLQDKSSLGLENCWWKIFFPNILLLDKPQPWLRRSVRELTCLVSLVTVAATPSIKDIQGFSSASVCARHLPMRSTLRGQPAVALD